MKFFRCFVLFSVVAAMMLAATSPAEARGWRRFRRPYVVYSNPVRVYTPVRSRVYYTTPYTYNYYRPAVNVSAPGVNVNVGGYGYGGVSVNVGGWGW